MDAAGYGCVFANGRYTAAMKPIIAKRGGFSQSAKTGDVIMWGGHFGIVVKGNEVCGAGQASMVAMGTHGCKESGCLSNSALNHWGSGGFLGYWTPR